jgi:O-antigen/teichoic acid export membrane protein
MSSLKQKTAQGLIWGGFSNGVVQLLQAVFGVWILNIITPEDSGKVAALVIFSNIASVLQESGFTAALANKREPTHEEYNAVFWFNVIVGITLYIILFFAAPFIADFYHEPVLCPLGRFAFLSFVFSCFGTAQRAYLFGHLMVKQSSIMQMASIIISGIAAVCMAYAGLAYWGLAAQSLVYVASVTAFAWYFSPWRPTFPAMQEEMNNEGMKNEKYRLPETLEELPVQKRKSYFSFFILSFITVLSPAWKMFGFSSKLLVNSLAFQLNNNAFGVLLNRFFPGGYIAGIFDNARKWDDRAISTIGGMVQGVAQPVLRDAAVGESGLVPAFRKMLRFTCFVSFPCLLGLALIAEDFIVLLVGEKWHESALLMSLLCVYGAFNPVVTLYSNLVISRGRSTINMIIGLVNCFLVWGSIITLHAFGLELREMVIFYVVLNIAWLFVWQACTHRLIGLCWWHAFKDIAPFFVFAFGVMALSWWLTAEMNISWTRMFLRIAVAAALYVGSLWLARAQILRESIDYIFHKKRV